MYGFVSHTWNTIKGRCYHDCSYCYMKRWGTLKPVRFDEKELKTDLGEGNYIFVGSSCDMFSGHLPTDWVMRTLEHCCRFKNKYLFQTKEPGAIYGFKEYLPKLSIVCTTIETNRHYPGIMGKSPTPYDRARAFSLIELDKYITIEPIIDFDLRPLVNMIKQCKPFQVNIGADTGNNNLPEPSWDKVEELIRELQSVTAVVRKNNLTRLQGK